MIKTFKHKGLKLFFETGSTRGITVSHKTRIKLILTELDGAERIQDMDLAGLDLHSLKGDLVKQWSVKVNGNWRIHFRFEDGHAYIVNYNDYH